ncbi:MAG: cadmium-translocating P-type ATPase [Gemmatimonadetes bacterium]|nr:cadmium-translocating P-type ATPase [Gemmatimonadota bacterium]
MTESVRLDIPLLLPDVEDDQDDCVARLVSMLEGRDGIERVHVAHDHDGVIVEHEVGEHPDGVPYANGALCLHYDPDRVSLAQLTDIATRAGATITAQYAHELIPFRSVGAEDEGARIEAALRALPGVTAAVVNFPAQLARVEFDVTQVRMPAILATLAEAGAAPVAPSETAAVEPTVTWYARNRELAWSVTSGCLTLAGWVAARVAPGTAPLPIVLYLAAYFFGARDNVGHLVKDLVRGRFRFNIDLLMVVAAVGAAALGAWAEGALLLFLFSMGHALEHYALGRARHAIKALAELAPQTATVRRGGADTVVPIELVRAGDLVVVTPGERVAVDGAVREGQSAVNQAPITGESVPVDKGIGDQLFAGSVNGEGLLLVEVTAAVGDRTLDRVIKLVAEAETQKASTQQFAERFERIFVPLVLIADVLLIVVPPMLGVWSWSDAFYRAMALLVAASPCALALGTPATVLAGIAQAARNGVLIKGGAHLEALGGIDVFALDKTGTLTRGEPEVTDLLAERGVDDAVLLASAAAVEQHSRHPLARAIARAATSRSLTVAEAEAAQSVTGRGMRAQVNGVAVEVGRLTLFDGTADAPPQSIRENVQRLESAGRTTMVVRAIGQTPEWLGVIGVADEARTGIRETLAELRALGVRRIVMLTGDNPGVAAAIARSVGLDDVRAGLMPEDKVTAIRELAAQGRVAMVGDGVNDAPALAHATVGIAMGGAGTAAALETADVALMGDDLSRLPFAVGLSRRARAIIRQNLFISMSVIGILVVSTVAGWARIGPAVIVHEGSTLIVVANALRLLRYRGGTRA